MTDILSDVPLPRKQSTRMLNEWPIENLESGQCFIIPCGMDEDERSKIERRLRAAASRYGRRLGRKYAVRRLDATQIGLWRTA